MSVHIKLSKGDAAELLVFGSALLKDSMSCEHRHRVLKSVMAQPGRSDKKILGVFGGATASATKLAGNATNWYRSMGHILWGK